MNERQLPGLSLHFPSRSREGSAVGGSRPLFGLQRRDFHPRAYGSNHADRRIPANGDTARVGVTGAHAVDAVGTTGAKRMAVDAVQRSASTSECGRSRPALSSVAFTSATIRRGARGPAEPS